MAIQQLETAIKQMENFKANLEEFALKYRDEIQRNPLFRSQFHKLCSKIGVDPLACKTTLFTFWFHVLIYLYEVVSFASSI